MTPRLGTIIPGLGRGFVDGEWLKIEEIGCRVEMGSRGIWGPIGGGWGSVVPRLVRGPPKAGVAASTLLST